MFFLLLVQVFSLTTFEIVDGNLTGCSSDEDTITIPSSVSRIVGSPFENLSATKLIGESNTKIELVDPGFLSGSSFKEVSLFIEQQSSSGIFLNQYLIQSIEIKKAWQTIPNSTFAGCIRLSSLKFASTTLLNNFSLTISDTSFVGANAFKDVVFYELSLTFLFFDYWAFPFAGSSFLQKINIKDRVLTFLVSEMFSGCVNLKQIIDSRETLLDDGQLNLLSLSIRDAGAKDVFKGVKIDTIVLPLNESFSSQFFNGLTDVTTLIIHSTFPGEDFKLPYLVGYFPKLSTLSIGAYEIMVDNVIDFTYTPLKSFGNSAFANLDVYQVFFSVSTTKIPPYCFDNCAYLNKVVVPYNIDEIPAGCFRNCKSLSSLVINGVELIVDNTLMLFNSNLAKIGNESFRGINISKILFVFPITLSENSFADNLQLQEIEFVDFQIGTDDFYSAPFRNTNVSIVKIPRGTFCYSLPSLSPFFFLGTPLQLLPEWSFTNCLPSVPDSSVLAGYEFHPNNTNRLVSCNLTQDSIALSDRIHYVSKHAFKNCGATEIIFADTLISVDEGAFLESRLQKITFPNTYSEMDFALFRSVTTVENVTFLSFIPNIPAFAFYSSQVTYIRVGAVDLLKDSVLDLSSFSSVGEDAFQFVNFKTLRIPSAIENHGSIGMSLLIENVFIEGNLTLIPANFFDGCKFLQHFSVNSIDLISANGLLDLSSLPTLNIGSYAFRNSSIKALKFHKNIYFHSNAFDGCDLTDVNCTSPIPSLFAVPPQLKFLNSLVNLYMDSVPIILNKVVVYNSSKYGNDAFAGLPIISASVNDLSISIFDGCAQLQNVSFLRSITTVPDNAFRGCTSLVSIFRYNGPTHYLLDNKFSTYNFIRIGTNAFFGVQFEYLSIQCFRLSIGDQAFASNNALKIVEFLNIGDTTFRIDNGAQIVRDCTNITLVNFSGANYCENIPILFEDLFSGTPLENQTWLDHGCQPDYSFLVFDDIDDSKLIHCTADKNEIILPEYIVTIANRAFATCNSKILRFLRDSRLTTLEPEAFNGSQFITVIFPPSLTVIPAHLFEDQNVIDTVIFEGRVTEIPEDCFNWATRLWYLEIDTRPVLKDRNLTLWLPTGRGAFVRNRLAYVTYLIDVEMLCNMFFYLEEVILFSSSIPRQMFGSVSTLTHIVYNGIDVLKNRVLDLTPITYVGENAFESTSIGTIILSRSTVFTPESFYSTGGDLTFNLTGFYSLEELQNLFNNRNVVWINLDSKPILMNNVVDMASLPFTSIPNYEFAKTSYTSITLPNSLTQLSEGLFENCSQLKTVVVPHSMTSIPNRVFYNCVRLTNITIDSQSLLANGTLNLFVSNVDSLAFAFANISKIIFSSPIFIRDRCFLNTSVKSIDFQISSIQFAQSPFMNCNNLSLIQIPSSACSNFQLLSFKELFRGSSIQESSWVDFGCSEKETPSGDNKNDSDSSGLSTSHVVLIVLIIVLVVVFVVVGVLLFLRHLRMKNEQHREEEDNPDAKLIET